MKKGDVSALLEKLRMELDAELGPQIEAVYLYGSQARGDAGPDSDVDVLVIVRGNFDYFALVERTGEIASRLSLQYDTVVSLAFISASNFVQQKTPFLLNIRREGMLIETG